MVEAERRLLERSGIGVEQVIFDNAELRESRSLRADAALAASAIWSRDAKRRVAAAIRTGRPDVMHVHNTFSAASPAVYAAAAAAAVPVVQTLHNYRFVCPSATAFRDGHACTDCVGRPIPWPGVVHACVRGSHAQSLVVAATMTFHRARGTYRSIGAFLALTRFQRRLMISGGLPASRVRVVPNFLESDPGAGPESRAGLVYIGRLSVEKGIEPLLAAAAEAPGILSIIGDGPLRAGVEQAHARGEVGWLGSLDRSGVVVRLQVAEALVVPSIWFEGFPLVVLEAFASGTPVIASRIGSLAEIVDDGVDGILVEAGDARALQGAMRWIRDHPAEARGMGNAARRKFVERFGPDGHVAALLDAYGSVTGTPREA